MPIKGCIVLINVPTIQPFEMGVVYIYIHTYVFLHLWHRKVSILHQLEGFNSYFFPTKGMLSAFGILLARKNMGVSKNRGTPKSSILIGFSIINHPFWGTLFLETPIWFPYFRSGKSMRRSLARTR